ncbi:hypothetical protein [Acidithiobacillus ferrooxidans]|uniref:hypothetical protein n=1 Tax=Acidithiobacillus ferrooxidans TaxID=920 RepID=UPI000A7CFD3D|nr:MULTISPECIES: hypothetical protein [Acidithiobacillus]
MTVQNTSNVGTIRLLWKKSYEFRVFAICCVWCPIRGTDHFAPIGVLTQTSDLSGRTGGKKNRNTTKTTAVEPDIQPGSTRYPSSESMLRRNDDACVGILGDHFGSVGLHGRQGRIGLRFLRFLPSRDTDLSKITQL